MGADVSSSESGASARAGTAAGWQVSGLAPVQSHVEPGTTAPVTPVGRCTVTVPAPAATPVPPMFATGRSSWRVRPLTSGTVVGTLRSARRAGDGAMATLIGGAT